METGMMELIAVGKKRKTKAKSPCNSCGRLTDQTICIKCRCKHGRLKMLCEKCSRYKKESA